MKSFINYCTAILCCACCLCSLSVNAQEIVVEFGTPTTGGTTGNLFFEFDNDMTIFETTLNDDGISNSNVLIEPMTFDVPEAGDAGLEITLVNATATLSLIHI